MIRSLILSVILLLSASIAHATDITWRAFSSDGIIGEQEVTLPNGDFQVEVIAHLPNFMDPGNTYPVTGELRADKCVNIPPGICGPNHGVVTVGGITYNFGDAVHNVSWDFFFAGAVSVPSQLSDPFATLTGPATLTGTYTIFDHGIALQDFTVDAVNGSLSMLVTRDLQGHYERHLSGTVAAAEFPVPEPSTWLLFGSGTLCLMYFGKRFTAS